MISLGTGGLSALILAQPGKAREEEAATLALAGKIPSDLAKMGAGLARQIF